MKKILLLAAACAASTFMFAEGPNLVTNGNFESSNFSQALHNGAGEYDFDPFNEYYMLESLEGWTVGGNAMWNGGAEILEEAGDGDLRAEDDMQYLRLWSFNDNGWEDLTASTIVKGLTPGQEYTLRFLMMHSWAEDAWGNYASGPDYDVTVSELDGDKAGKEIVKYGPSDLQDDQEFVEHTFTFTPTSADIYLNFRYGNQFWEGNHHEGHWMAIDNVTVADPNGTSAVNTIGDENANAPVEFFNLQGMRVNNAEKGIYIKRQGNKTIKVTL